MKSMTHEQARQFADRWQLVRAQEADELRRCPIEVKLRQLATLMASRDLIPPDPRREQLVAATRRRWSQLRQAIGSE